MELKDKVVVVTGGASGIGQGLVERFHTEGARHIVVADLDEVGATRVAESVGGTGVGLDVTDEAALAAMVERTIETHGPIDLFVSNAGYVTVGGVEIDNSELTNMFDVHVMAHLYAARVVLPSMIARGEGYLLNTASAAGLLTQIGSLSYAVTKHAAVALAEWLAVTHGSQGIKVSVLCPQAVESNITQNSPSKGRLGGGGAGVAAADGVLTAAQLADTVIETLAAERFHVLPHDEVSIYVERKAADVDRWIKGMQRFQERLYLDNPTPGEWLLES
ncbi:MAG: SDR family oxidoreductase [Actinobacteria bacterium]|nr:SDR family oxidoreductase [Actinomycetota bacterium]